MRVKEFIRENWIPLLTLIGLALAVWYNFVHFKH